MRGKKVLCFLILISLIISNFNFLLLKGGIENSENNEFSPDIVLDFYEDFNSADLSQWNLTLNTGLFDYSVQNGELVVKTFYQGYFELTSVKNLTNYNVLIDGMVYCSSFLSDRLASLNIDFISQTAGTIGEIKYCFSDNIVWYSNMKRKVFQIDSYENQYNSISDLLSSPNRNLTYCLNQYLSNVNKSAIDYFKIKIEAYSDTYYSLDELVAIFDNIVLIQNITANSFLEINDFSDFNCELDNPQIQSTNNNETIDFSYDSYLSSMSIENYLDNFNGIGNGFDFNIELRLIYNCTSQISIGAIGCNLTSYYDRYKIYNPTTFASMMVNDNSSTYYGYPVINCLENGTIETFSANPLTTNSSGELIFKANRTNSYLSLSIIDSSTNISLVEHIMSTFDYYPLNGINLFFISSILNDNNSASFLSINALIKLDVFTSIKENIHNDANLGCDAGSDRNSALAIITSGNYSGGFPQGDNEDFYCFYIALYKKITIHLDPISIQYFTYAIEEPIGIICDRSSPFKQKNELTVEPTVNGWWYFSVSVNYYGLDNYNFSITIESSSISTNQNDANQGADAGSSIFFSFSIPFGTSSGSFLPGDYIDFYDFAIQGPCLLAINLSYNEDSQFEIILFNSDQDIVSDENFLYFYYLEFNFTIGDIYYLEIFRDYGYGEYNLTLEIKAIYYSVVGPHIDGEMIGVILAVGSVIAVIIVAIFTIIKIKKRGR